jgi:hypothetical protein
MNTDPRSNTIVLVFKPESLSLGVSSDRGRTQEHWSFCAVRTYGFSHLSIPFIDSNRKGKRDLVVLLPLRHDPGISRHPTRPIVIDHDATNAQAKNESWCNRTEHGTHKTRHAPKLLKLNVQRTLSLRYRLTRLET